MTQPPFYAVSKGYSSMENQDESQTMRHKTEYGITPLMLHTA
jgi:hypothetical protein